MKQFFARLMAKMLVLVHLVAVKFGFWGIGILSLFESASIPLPMDAILASYVWQDKSHFWIYTLVASVGSSIGALLPFGLGRAGGELFLLKRINRQRFEKMRIRFERQEFLAVLVPSMLPPPTPWKAFVFAAGVFEMRIVPFMLAVFAGRVIRWLVLSLLVLKLGPGAVSVVGEMLKQHLELVMGAVVLIFVAIGLWAILRRRRSGDAQESL